MKTLSIQQPWASLIACGIKDVENRTTRMLVPPQRVLIHTGVNARDMSILNKLPFCWEFPVRNAELIEQFDRGDEFVKSAIIGYVDVVDIVEDSHSVWAQYAHEGAKPVQHYILENAHLFKEPILNVKGKLGVWNYPDIDENNLPETVDIPKFECKGDTLVFPCNEDRWNAIKEEIAKGESIMALSLYLLDSNFDLFAEWVNDEEWDTLPYKKLLLTNKGESMEVDITNIYIDDVTYDDNHEPIVFESPAGDEYSGMMITYEFKLPKA
jgi:hypothetical protein